MPLLSRKLKNELTAINPNLEFINLKNVRINGVNHGCSGFVRNPETGIIVYVCTDMLNYSARVYDCLYRVAKDEKDYHGGINMYAKSDVFAKVVADYTESNAARREIERMLNH